MEQGDTTFDPVNDVLTITLGTPDISREIEEEKGENVPEETPTSNKKWISKTLKYGVSLGFSIAILYALYSV